MRASCRPRPPAVPGSASVAPRSGCSASRASCVCSSVCPSVCPSVSPSLLLVLPLTPFRLLPARYKRPGPGSCARCVTGLSSGSVTNTYRLAVHSRGVRGLSPCASTGLTSPRTRGTHYHSAPGCESARGQCLSPSRPDTQSHLTVSTTNSTRGNDSSRGRAGHGPRPVTLPGEVSRPLSEARGPARGGAGRAARGAELENGVRTQFLGETPAPGSGPVCFSLFRECMRQDLGNSGDR